MYNFPKIQFGEKAFYVVDDFEYDGRKYYYIYEDVYEEGMDISKFDGDIEINFIFKREDGKFENGVEVTPEILYNAGIISKIEEYGVKVLGDGELTKKLVVKANKFTKSAVEKIEKAGGKAEVL